MRAPVLSKQEFKMMRELDTSVVPVRQIRADHEPCGNPSARTKLATTVGFDFVLLFSLRVTSKTSVQIT